MLPDDQLDPDLLAQGDSRNVADHYRYWPVAAIRHDLEQRSTGLEIAIENLARDFNMGTIVRSANAFGVRRLHIIGRRQWNKRGAMKTDAYLDIVYHASVDDFVREVGERPLVMVDNTSGAEPLHHVTLPYSGILVFGSEQSGISPELAAHASLRVEIEQFGSTRSINVGVASGILMYKWVEQHILRHS